MYSYTVELGGRVLWQGRSFYTACNKAKRTRIGDMLRAVFGVPCDKPEIYMWDRFGQKTRVYDYTQWRRKVGLR